MSRKKFSKEFKLKLLKEHDENGISYWKLGKEYGIEASIIRRWGYAYATFGEAGLEKHNSDQCNYSAEFKQMVVTEYLEGKISIQDLAYKHKILAPSTVRTWIKQYNNHEELTNSRKEGVHHMVKNMQREHIKPSEKAFAYKMKLEALQHQGRSFGQLDQKSGGYDARKELSKQIGESERQIQRYIRLTNLIPKILQMVDDGVIAFTVAVELSYLTEDEQYELHAVMDIEQCTPSLSQANRMKRMSQGEGLDVDMIYQVLEEIKLNQREVIKLDLSKVAKYMPRNYTPKQMEDLIEKLLMDWSVSNHTYS